MVKHIEQITSDDLAGMSPAEFDTMPFGMIRLDRTGKITLYNAWEAQLARRNVADVMGKNFFTEVAPCTNVAAFRGKLDEVATSEQKTHVFDYDFAFPWGVRRVRVRFVVDSPEERWVLVTNVPNLT